MCTFYRNLGFGMYIDLPPAGGTYTIIIAGTGRRRQEFLSTFGTKQFRHFGHLLAILSLVE
jgi:hypothetical protein